MPPTTTVTFAQAGRYTLAVVLQEPGGLTTVSNATVVINPLLTDFLVDPPSADVVGATQLFGVQAFDQFGEDLEAVPPGVTWSVTGGGKHHVHEDIYGQQHQRFILGNDGTGECGGHGARDRHQRHGMATAQFGAAAAA